MKGKQVPLKDSRQPLVCTSVQTPDTDGGEKKSIPDKDNTIPCVCWVSQIWA